MKFSALASCFEKLEKTASRNQMTEILSEMFADLSPNEAEKVSYLSQGRVAPLYEKVEMGMADKMVIRAIALAFSKTNEEVLRLFKDKGDLGTVSEILNKKKESNLTIDEAFTMLSDITQSAGKGSVEQKIKVLSLLLSCSESLSSRFLARIPVGKLRLGFSDMTVLDALSWMLSGSKREREKIERAYNVRPDLGYIARTIKEKQVAGLNKVEPEVGVPILMARSERLNSAEEIIGKIGKCAVEPKIDGFRLQAHLNRDKGEVTLFTRNLEDATFMYPDLVVGIKEQIRGKKVIFEGEAIAYNPETGEYLPFQETVQRKRKYNIEEVSLTIPLKLILFDCLYVDGNNLIDDGYLKRRETLKKIVRDGQVVILAGQTIVEKADDLTKIFEDAVSRGLEGIMAKRLDGVYQAGARGWNWIKLKRSYQGKLEDTIDAVVMGYDFGQGKRTGFGIGAFLIGVYDRPSDTFKTIAKIGTGLTDNEWRQLKSKIEKIKTSNKPARYEVNKLITCDVWAQPEIMVTVRADEISRSPVHTAGQTQNQPGFALRFPRLVDFRDDKTPEDATTVSEIEQMYKLQFKRK